MSEIDLIHQNFSEASRRVPFASLRHSCPIGTRQQASKHVKLEVTYWKLCNKTTGGLIYLIWNRKAVAMLSQFINTSRALQELAAFWISCLLSTLCTTSTFLLTRYFPLSKIVISLVRYAHLSWKKKVANNLNTLSSEDGMFWEDEVNITDDAHITMTS